MDSPTPLQRLLLAFYAFFAVLFRAEVAAAVWRLYRERHAAPALGPAAGAPPRAEAAPPPPAAPAAPPRVDGAVAAPPAAAPAAPPAAALPTSPAAAPRAGADARGALYVLALLQREGRLLDFVEEDVAAFPDATVGAAARTVHEGCRRALRDVLRLEPVLREPEGAAVTVERGFDPAAVRLTGSVVGAPPFRGALRHHGWRAQEVRLPPPRDGLDPAILAPAEVEL